MIKIQEEALKEETDCLFGQSMSDIFSDDSGEDQVINPICEKPLIDWNLNHVEKFLSTIDSGNFNKHVPFFMRNTVSGEVLLSLERTVLKNEYGLTRKEIKKLYTEMFAIDANFKDRMIKKWKKKRRARKNNAENRILMCTIDWDEFLAKSYNEYSWNKVHYWVGDVVRLKDKREGRLMFKGETKFAQGTWLGIEITNGIGLNDGSINGTRYFQTKKGRGIFVREQKVWKKLSIDCFELGTYLKEEKRSLSIEAISEESNLRESVTEKDYEWDLSTSSEEESVKVIGYRRDTSRSLLSLGESV